MSSNFPRLKVENPLEQIHGNVFTEMQMCDTVRPSHSSGRIIGRSAENSLGASRYFRLWFEGEWGIPKLKDATGSAPCCASFSRATIDGGLLSQLCAFSRLPGAHRWIPGKMQDVSNCSSVYSGLEALCYGREGRMSWDDFQGHCRGKLGAECIRTLLP